MLVGVLVCKYGPRVTVRPLAEKLKDRVQNDAQNPATILERRRLDMAARDSAGYHSRSVVLGGFSQFVVIISSGGLVPASRER